MLFCLLTVLSTATATPGEVLANFVSVQYAWDDEHREKDYVASGNFIVENNVITGIKADASTTYLSVPRWRSGVPSTLSTLETSALGPRLRPFPSWAMNEVGNCSALQYVQSMEVVGSVMWVIDVGRRDILSATPDNTCPPKILLLDLQHGGAVVDSYTFPDDVASHTSSFLNDIVVDTAREVAFMSDAGTGAIVVFDRQTRRSWRFADETTAAEPSVTFTIDGIDYGNSTFTTPSDGIALTPDRSRLVHCALQGLQLWSHDARVLGDAHATTAQIQATQQLLGVKASPSDGLAFTCNGTLFFGGLTTDALYSWSYAAAGGVDAAGLLDESPALHWVDTFGFDTRGGLLLTSNRLDLFFTKNMDFTGAAGPNMRLIRYNFSVTSYLAGPCPPSPSL